MKNFKDLWYNEKIWETQKTYLVDSRYNQTEKEIEFGHGYIEHTQVYNNKLKTFFIQGKWDLYSQLYGLWIYKGYQWWKI